MHIPVIKRLEAAIVAVCPIDGVAILDPVTHSVRIDYAASSTAPQRAAAAAALAAFDWSNAAQQTWEDSQEPDLSNLRDQAVQAVSDINTYLAGADTATAAQVRAEVKAIDQRQRGIIKALARLARLATSD